MKLLNLQPLTKVYTTKFQGSFELTRKSSYTFIENGIEISKEIETIEFSKAINSHQATLQHFGPISNETIISYHNFKNLINHCKDNSERTSVQLREYLLSLKDHGHSQAFLLSQTFQGLRNIFYTHIKSTKSLWKKEYLSTHLKREELNNTLKKFIQDRNIYTHGSLKLVRPVEIFIIEYVHEKTRKQKAVVTEDNIRSFLSVAKELNNIISDFRMTARLNANK